MVCTRLVRKASCIPLFRCLLHNGYRIYGLWFSTTSLWATGVYATRICYTIFEFSSHSSFLFKILFFWINFFQYTKKQTKFFYEPTLLKKWHLEHNSHYFMNLAICWEWRIRRFIKWYLFGNLLRVLGVNYIQKNCN